MIRLLQPVDSVRYNSLDTYGSDGRLTRCMCYIGRRIGQTCPGYYDASSLIFRDETTRVIDRARTIKPHRRLPGTARSTASTQSPSPSMSPSWTSSPVLAILSDHIARDPTQENGCQSNEKGSESINGENLSQDDKENSPDGKGKEEEGYWDKDMDVIVDGYPPFVLEDVNSILDNTNEVSWELSSSFADPPPFLGSDLDAQVMSLLFTPAAPSESLHEMGINYFMSNYVLKDSGPCPGFLNYTSDIFHNPIGDTDLAQVAVCAVGLAGLAGTTGAESIMCKARSSYAEAIERVNAALIDPAMAMNDSTVFAVMALGLFESITCSGEESLEAWKHHINGAANLLMHRGIDQFRTKLGVRIFGETVSHVLTLCSCYGLPVPPRLRLLRVEMERKVACKGPSWALSTLHIEVMDLFHRVDPEEETPSLPNEWESLLSQAVELDRRIENLAAELPIHWRFKTVCDPGANSQVVYHGTYHIYYNTWVGKVWDGMRACRIILNQVIYCLLLREGLAWAPDELTPDKGAYAGMVQRVADTTTEMRDGILASVPQMLGYVQHEAAMGTSYLDCSTGGVPHLVPASGAYFLLWYLYLAGSLPINTEDTRAWVVDRLRAIRSATGIQKAGYLADTLENDRAFLSAVLPTNEFLFPSF